MGKRSPDRQSVLHIEVGAGRLTFGRDFYSECFLTDNDEELETVYRVTTLDEICDAHSLPWPDNRFQKVIMCNPYDYGFRDPDQSENLLAELTRVLTDKGQIIVIGARTNPWCAPYRIEKGLRNFESKTTFRYNLEIISIDSQTEYPKCVFETKGFTRTYPNFRAEIELRKQ